MLISAQLTLMQVYTFVDFFIITEIDLGCREKIYFVCTSTQTKISHLSDDFSVFLSTTRGSYRTCTNLFLAINISANEKLSLYGCSSKNLKSNLFYHLAA